MFLNMEDIQNYVQENSIEELLKNAILNFYGHEKNLQDVSLGDLKDRFDREEFNETGEKSDYFFEHIQDIKQNVVKYTEIYQKLNDEKSKKTFVNLLNAKLFADNRYIEEVYEKNEMYFDSEIYNVSKIETYVDCGGYTGDSAVRFSLNNPDYKKIYVFEPIDSIANQSVENLKKQLPQGNFEVLKKAVYNIIGKIGINPELLQGESHIDQHSKDNIVDTTTLDFEIKEDIDLIKLDIEGSEKEAILGAKDHIARNHPVLAVCVYHLKDDFWKIPELIESIRTDYDIYLRQYDPEVYSETVMYFIPSKFEQTQKNEKHLTNKCNLLEMFRLYTDDEYYNILRHVNDKKWFIRQLRMKESLLTENKNWIMELERVKLYEEEQIKLKDCRIKELEEWIKEIEDTKKYQEEQVKSKDCRIRELEEWIEELEKGKNWLEEKNTELQKDLEVTEEKSTLLEDKLIEKETEVSKLNYKLDLIKKDNILSKIIKMKKLEI